MDFTKITHSLNSELTQEEKISQLFKAVENNNILVVGSLLKQDIDLEAKDKWGYTLLHWACEKGYVEIATLLIQHGHKVEVTEDWGNTPFHFACGNGHITIVTLLIQHNVKLESQNALGNTSLHVACKNRHSKIAAFLIQQTPNLLNIVNRKNETPLHLTCEEGQVEIADVLIQHDANLEDKDENGNTPLHLACEEGHIETAALLIQHGANLEDKDENGNTPLHVACQYGQAKIVALLIQHGANLEARNNCEMIYDKESLTSFTLSPEKKNMLGICGETVLHVAASWGRTETVAFLIQKCPNLINALTWHGYTPLDYAHQHPTTLGLLMQNGARLEAGNRKGYTLLARTLYSYRMDMAFCILSFMTKDEIDKMEKELFNNMLNYYPCFIATVNDFRKQRKVQADKLYEIFGHCALNVNQVHYPQNQTPELLMKQIAYRFPEWYHPLMLAHLKGIFEIPYILAKKQKAQKQEQEDALFNRLLAAPLYDERLAISQELGSRDTYFNRAQTLGVANTSRLLFSDITEFVGEVFNNIYTPLSSIMKRKHEEDNKGPQRKKLKAEAPLTDVEMVEEYKEETLSDDVEMPDKDKRPKKK